MYINVWAIIVAAIVSTIIGAIWYSPMLFGKTWMKLSNVHPNSTPTGRQAMMKATIINFIATLVSMYVLSKLISWVCGGSLSDAIKLGLFVWFGFVATIGLTAVIWEKKPWKLYFINTFQYLFSIVVGAWIIGAWR